MPHPVTRAERRALARQRPFRKQRPKYDIYVQKKWSQIYLRSNKLLRARQLGRLWPYREWEKAMTENEPAENGPEERAPLKLLFVCSRNQWRSPTAEAAFRRWEGVETRSAGTSRNARRAISFADVQWADLILVMEEKHASRLRAEFRQALRFKPLHVLDIPDDYRFMDPALVEILEETVAPLIEAGRAG